MVQISPAVALFVVVVAVIVWAMVWGPCSLKCNVDKSGYIATVPHYPQTYYDQGGWNQQPPQVPQYPPGYTEGYSTDAPPPLHLADHADLCQECIGHCQIKIWADLVNVPKGTSNKEYCANECSLECKILT